MKRHLRWSFAAMTIVFSSLLAISGFTVFDDHQIALAQRPGDPADELLQAASEAMSVYDTMKFDLTYEQGSTKLFTGIQMTEVTGAIQRPGRLEATVKTKVGFINIGVTGIVIGDKAWVRAVGISEDYDLPENLEHIIADPVALLTDLAGAVRDPVVSEIETTPNGERFIWIRGLFDPSLVDDEAVQGYTERLGTQEVEIALDEENRIVSLRVPGRFASWDSDDVIRRLDLYDFGEPVDIEKP